MAWTASWPIPGHAKTVSVTTAPPSNVPTWRPSTVTMGIRAFFRAWRQTTSRAGPSGGEDAERDTQACRDQEGRKGQLQGGGQALQDVREHRSHGPDGLSEVTPRRAAEEAPVLLEERPVEAQGPSHLGDALRR